MFWKKKKKETNTPPEGMNLKEAIKAVIKGLENSILYYDWEKTPHCNCGLMVQALTGLSSQQVAVFKNRAKSPLTGEDAKTGVPTWAQSARYNCSITGLPTDHVFQTLHDKGFRIKDIVHLEFMDNPTLLRLSGINTEEKYYYMNPKNLILYLKAWLGLIEQDERIEALLKEEDRSEVEEFRNAAKTNNH